MAFWGVEIKPGKPYSHRFDKTRGRLHISQATLGFGSGLKISSVQCNIGDNSPVLLCSLIPNKTESCQLDLEFEEDDEVVFSVIGVRSIHLTGYYLDKCSHFDGADDDTDSYGEDIGETDSEQYSDSEDEYEDDFIDDDDDFEMFSSSPRQNTGVVIEEILDDEKAASGNGDRRRHKKYEVSDSEGDNQKQIIPRGGTSIIESESEDEDGLPISSLSKTKVADESAEVEEKSDKKVIKGSKKKAEDNGDRVTSSKRKIEKVVQNSETQRGIEQPNNSSLPSLEVGHENAEKPKKKKKKERAKEGKIRGGGDESMIDVHKDDKAQIEEAKTQQPVRDEADEKLSNDKSVEIDAENVADEDHTEVKKKKKKKKNKNKTPESDKNESKKGSVVEIKKKKAEVKPSQERSYPNGLVVEELEMGKPDGRRASPGNKISVRYIGKLKKTGEIFDSNIGRAPFKFRLGVGGVIKGWDVGVNGMRVGDKRRLTIPPSMGYGSKGAGPKIPPNAWLVFDVELVDVR